MTADEVFLAAVEKATPAERAAYLDWACAGDAALRGEVEWLLHFHNQAANVLNQPQSDVSPTVDLPRPAEGPGARIGPYKLLQKLGEGGMGVVYMAEQKQPVERRVALKIIKPGMDSRQVIARFEAERQALALMDHPHIARVVDAGTTDAGRPYFVMELVKGIPITQYCDEHQLTPRERLELFLPVCQAVQHAHQKGIIHRDLKPTNVLVAEYDQRPVPKIIDFGVAKAIGQRLTEKTMFTEFGQIVGTIEYMSPEQAKLNQLDIDTRTDIYSLGVLLYELLTGEMPLDRKRLRSAAFDEMLRIIREEEPPRPSTRLSSTDALPAIAARRHTEPKKLAMLMRGELDWIVMKALEKDRNRRYETANGLGMDIQRYLSDEHVLACPPSAGYRLRKFARRNKAVLAPAALLVGVLLLGTVISSWQAIRATEARDGEAEQRQLAQKNAADADAQRKQAERNAAEAESQREQAEKNAAEADAQRKQAEKNAAEADAQRNQAERNAAEADAQRKQAETNAAEAKSQREQAEKNAVEAELQREQAEANFAQARKAVDDYFVEVSESELLKVPGMQPLRSELLRSALEFYQEFVARRGDEPRLKEELAHTHARIGRILHELDQHALDSRAFNDALRLYRELLRDEPTRAELKAGEAACRQHLGKLEEAIAIWEQLRQADPENKHYRAELAQTWNNLAFRQRSAKQLSDALTSNQKARDLRMMLVAEEPGNAAYLHELGQTLNNIGVILSDLGRRQESLDLYKEAVGLSEKARAQNPASIDYGEGLAVFIRNVAQVERELGHSQEALTAFERHADICHSLASRNPAVPSLQRKMLLAFRELSQFQRQLNRPQEAVRSLRQAREVIDRLPRDTAEDWYVFAQVKALCAAPPDDVGTTEDPVDGEARQKDADDAVAAVRTAIEKGFSDLPRLQREQKEFAAIAANADFRRLIAAAQQLAELPADTQPASAPDTEQALAAKLNTSSYVAEALARLSEADPNNVLLLASYARSLHMAGLARLRLRQYDEGEKSLHEALRIREQIRDRQPRSAQAALDVIDTRAELARRYEYSDRIPQAHALRQRCLMDFRTLPNDPKLAAKAGEIEYWLRRSYAALGLWPVAVVDAQRSAVFQRPVATSSLAPLLPLTGQEELLRAYCRMCYARSSEPRVPAWPISSDLFHLSGLLNPPALPPETLERLAQPFESSPGPVDGVRVALAKHRAGKHAEALKILDSQFTDADFESFDSPLELEPAYLSALAAGAAGQDERARKRLQQAEALFQQACRNWISGDDNKMRISLKGNWWQFVYAQILRREAWQVIAGQPADESWLHLNFARGYRALGELQKAEVELAAAAPEGSSNIQILRARADLLQTWGDPARAEADWRKILAAAGDDPAPWIQCGQFYAKLNQPQKAAECYAEAIAPKSARRPPLAAIPFSVEEAARLQRAWADHLGIPVEYENSVGMRFRLVPPGVFDMGTPPDVRKKIVEELKRQGVEAFHVRPHEEEGFARVFLTAPYYIARCEVTVQQFLKFVEDTGFQTDGEKRGVGGYASRAGKWVRDPRHVWFSPSEGWEFQPDQPVVHISWNDANAFCDWLTKTDNVPYTLPTEAQWEFACRGGSPTLYGVGDDPSVLEQIAWTGETSRTAGVKFAQPVGGKQANPFGLHDMLGSAFEWCADAYDRGPTGPIPLVDPLNSQSPAGRVTRGGAWYQNSVLVTRCGHRIGRAPNDPHDVAQGIRVAILGDLKHVLSASAAPRQPAQETPRDASSLASHARSRHSIAAVRLGLGDLDGAIKSLEEARGSQEKLLEQDPQQEAYLVDLGNTCYVLGHAHWKAERLKAARESWNQGFEVLQPDVSDLPEENQRRRTLAEKEFDLAEHYGKLGHWTLAARHWNNSRAADRYLSAGWEARLALLDCLLDERRRYAEQCRDLVERFAATVPISVAWACAASPESSIDPQRIMELAQQGLKSQPSDSGAPIAVAFAHFRCKEFESVRLPLSQPFAFLRATLAFHLGQQDEARSLLESAEREFAEQSKARLLEPGATIPASWDKTTWWDFCRIQIRRLEAWRVIAGKTHGDPWRHLTEARLWSKLGDAEAAERSFQWALEAAPGDVQVRLVRARLYAQLGDHEKALADWAEALAFDPDNFEPWIARARYLAERGEQQQADSDFAKAAALMSQRPAVEINRAENIDAWLLMAMADWRRGEMDQARRRFSQAAHSMELNKERIESSKPQAERLRSLRAEAEQLLGANEIEGILSRSKMVEAQAREHARWKRWSEAAEVYKEALVWRSADPLIWNEHASTLLLTGDLETYHTFRDILLKQAKTNTYGQAPYHLLRTPLLAPLAPADAAQSVDRAKSVISATSGTWSLNNAGLACLRAGQFEAAIAYFQQSLEADKELLARCVNWPLLALAHHGLGQTDEAQHWLEKASGFARKHSDGQVMNLQPWLGFHLLLREAERVVGNQDQP